MSWPGPCDPSQRADNGPGRHHPPTAGKSGEQNFKKVDVPLTRLCFVAVSQDELGDLGLFDGCMEDYLDRSDVIALPSKVGFRGFVVALSWRAFMFSF